MTKEEAIETARKVFPNSNWQLDIAVQCTSNEMGLYLWGGGIGGLLPIDPVWVVRFKGPRQNAQGDHEYVAAVIDGNSGKIMGSAGRYPPGLN